jgi:hypothetical protein
MQEMLTLDFIVDFSILWSLLTLGICLLFANFEHMFTPHDADIRPFAGTWFGLGLALFCIGEILQLTVGTHPEAVIAYQHLLLVDRVTDIVSIVPMLGGLILILVHSAKRPRSLAFSYFGVLVLITILATLLAFEVRK